MNTFEEWNRVISNGISLTGVLEKAFNLTTPDDVTWVYVNKNKELTTKTFPNLRKVINGLTEDLYTNAPLYSVDSISDLRKLDKPYDKVYAKGYYNSKDNAFGSNFYVWYPNNTDPDDKGLTIKLDNFETGRYKLVHSYPIVIGWFGITKDNYDEKFVKLLIDKYKKVYDNITNTLYDDTIRKTDSLSMTKLELTNDNNKFELINDIIVDKYYKTSDMSYIRNTIFGLTDITNPKEDDVCHVTSYYGNDDISGTYIYKKDIIRTMHDGGRYISPTRSPNNWWNYVIDEDKGCWVKIANDSYASLSEYGAIHDNTTDNNQIINAILRNNKHIYIPKGIWKTSIGINMNVNNETDRNFYIKGEGVESVLYITNDDGIYSNNSVNLKLIASNFKIITENNKKGISINNNLINSIISDIYINASSNGIYIKNTVNTRLENIKATSQTNVDVYTIEMSYNTTLINCVGKTSNTDNGIFNINGYATLIGCGSWLDFDTNIDVLDDNVKCGVWGIFGHLDKSVTPAIDYKYNITLINCNISNFKQYGLMFRNDGNAILTNNVFRTIPKDDYNASIYIEKCTGMITCINNKYLTADSTRTKKSEVYALIPVGISGIDNIDINNVLYQGSDLTGYIDDTNNLNISGYNNLYVDQIVINKIDYKNPSVAVDMIWNNAGKGPILVDRKDGTKYRLFIDDGNFGIEEV